MAITMKEAPESRELHYGAQGGGQTLVFNAVCTAGENEVDVYAYALVFSSPYFNGFVRQDIKVVPQKGPLYRVNIEYGTTGKGGGDQPSGTAPTTPTGPAADSTPLTSGFSFSLTPFQTHITQSLETISATKRDGGTAPDFKGAICVDEDGKIEGCDIPPNANFTFKRTVARANVTREYQRTISNLCGKVNTEPFYGFDAGQAIYTGCDGQFTEGEAWSLTHSFGAAENQLNITICDGLVVPSKKAFEFLWVYYEWTLSAGKRVKVPAAAYVEKVLKDGNFSIIEIGT